VKEIKYKAVTVQRLAFHKKKIKVTGEEREKEGVYEKYQANENSAGLRPDDSGKQASRC
jgi:hypothetical protein